MIGVKKITGGSYTDSFVIQGVGFAKTFSYAGFEQQPKKFVNAKILLLNLELELKAEKDNAEIRLNKPSVRKKRKKGTKRNKAEQKKSTNPTKRQTKAQERLPHCQLSRVSLQFLST